VISKIVNFIGDSQNSGKLKKIGYAALVVTFISDFFVHREHAVYIWDKIPGWGAFYGFVSCVLIIIVSKFIGHQGGIMKKEDYYD
jgi:purine-cytosine permease-like protein